MPRLIAAALASPPVEIAVLDYNSQDGLGDYIQTVKDGLNVNVKLTYNKYTKREYYHLAHAYNLAVLSSSGEYVAVMGADAVLSENYVTEAWRLIDKGCIWMRGPHYKGIIVIERAAFIAAGGYDEQFEFYGSEDKDLEARLIRRGLSPCIMSDGLVRTIRTSNADKVKNYRLPLNKAEMAHRAHRILNLNNSIGTLVANQGIKWGAND